MRALAVLLAALLLALSGAALAGCGDDDSGAEDATASFGAEANAEDEEAIVETTESFLTAQARGQWEDACELMTTAVRKQVEQLAASSKRLKGEDCAAILAAVFKQNPAQLQASADGIEVKAVRIQNTDRGYVFYSTPQSKAAYLPLEREQGEWRVATISGSSAPTQQ